MGLYFVWERETLHLDVVVVLSLAALRCIDKVAVACYTQERRARVECIGALMPIGHLWRRRS